MDNKVKLANKCEWVDVKDTNKYEWVDVSVPSLKNSTTTTGGGSYLPFSIDDVFPPLPKKKIATKKPKPKKKFCPICNMDTYCWMEEAGIKQEASEPKKPKPKLKTKTYQVEQLNTKAREKERLVIDDGLLEIIRKI